jgi:hypothetical protein
MSSPGDTKSTSTDSGQAAPTIGVSDQLYSSYLEHRRYLIESEQEAAKSYDRWLLTLSGGALGLSMAFARDIAPLDGAEGRPCLLAAWLALAFAVAVGLVCIQLSQRAHADFRDVLDATLETARAKNEDAGFWDDLRTAQVRCRRAWWVGWLNWVSISAFVAGIVLLSVFAFLNVPLRSNRTMAEKPIEPTERVVPVEQPVPCPVDMPEELSREPSKRADRAMAPAPGPIGQVPPPKPTPPASEE